MAAPVCLPALLLQSHTCTNRGALGLHFQVQVIRVRRQCFCELRPGHAYLPYSWASARVLRMVHARLGAERAGCLVWIGLSDAGAPAHVFLVVAAVAYRHNGRLRAAMGCRRQSLSRARLPVWPVH